MAIWCIYFMSVPTSILGILSRSNSSIDSSWMAPLMPSVIMMRGLTWFVVVVDFCFMVGARGFVYCCVCDPVVCEWRCYAWKEWSPQGTVRE